MTITIKIDYSIVYPFHQQMQQLQSKLTTLKSTLSATNALGKLREGEADKMV